MEDCMAEIRLRVLTFNAHLMAESNIVVGAWAKNKLPVTFNDEERYYEILNRIRSSGADIVALQEVWAEEWMEWFQRDLYHEYHMSIAGSGGASMYEFIEDYLDHGIPDRAAGSGLVLLSKINLHNPDFHLFPEPYEDEERAASKGVLTATVSNNDLYLRVGNAHAWTDAGGLRNIEDLVRWTIYPDMNAPAVIMGDFNIHRRGNQEKFNQMNDMLNGRNFQDSWTLAHGTNPDGSETDDQAHNNLAQLFSPMRNTERADCLDYVYVKSSPNISVKVLDAKVLKDWKTERSPHWYWVHEGTVHGTPSATPFGPNLDKLCVASRDTNDGLRVAVYDRNTMIWKSKLVAGASASGAPGIGWWNGKLYLLYQGTNGLDLMQRESEDGETWTEPSYSGVRTSGGCSAVVFRDELWVFVRDWRGEQICGYIWDGRGWRGPKWITLETDHNISAAATDKEICVVARDRGNLPGGVMNVRIDQFGNVGPVHQTGADASTTGSPGITALDGFFHVFYRSDEGDGVIFTRSTSDNWVNEEHTIYETTDEVCPVAFDNKIWLFYAKPVWNTRKEFPGNISYPYDAVMYPERPLTHSYWPSDVSLDLSDHYPYQVDLLVSTT